MNSLCKSLKKQAQLSFSGLGFFGVRGYRADRVYGAFRAWGFRFRVYGKRA